LIGSIVARVARSAIAGEISIFVVSANAGTKYVDASAYVVDLGSKVGVLQPIPMGDTCSLCHGTKSWMPEDVAAVLARSYPNDEATGFTTGDVRGWVWAEVPKK
jgi:hypothetical protein